MLGQNLVFIDSIQKFVQNLPKDKLKYLSKKFCGKKLELVKQKGIYPYEHMNGFEKFVETKLLYSSWRDERVSNKDYEHAEKVWSWFEMKKVRDYHDLYLKKMFFLLADVFEELRNVCLEYYGLESLSLFQQ